MEETGAEIDDYLNRIFNQPSPQKVVRNGQWVVKDPQWQEHTILVLLRDREVAWIECEVTLDKFEFAREATRR